MHSHWQSHYFPARTTTSNLSGSATRAIYHTAYITPRINGIPEDDLAVIKANQIRLDELRRRMKSYNGMYGVTRFEARRLANIGELFEGRNMLEQQWYLQGLVRSAMREVERIGRFYG
jgi:hypothetical protein